MRESKVSALKMKTRTSSPIAPMTKLVMNLPVRFSSFVREISFADSVIFEHFSVVDVAATKTYPEAVIALPSSLSLWLVLLFRCVVDVASHDKWNDKDDYETAEAARSRVKQVDQQSSCDTGHNPA